TSATHLAAPDKSLAAILLLASTSACLVGLLLGSNVIFLGVIGIAISSTYLLLRDHFRADDELHPNDQVLKASAILLFAFLTLSVVFLRSGASIYQRSLIHFVSVALAFGILSWHSVIRHGRFRTEMLVLAEITVVSLWVRL